MFGGVKQAAGIERVAVGILAWLAKSGDAAVCGPFLQLIVWDIAENQETPRVPGRPFEEPHARAEFLQFGPLGNDLRKGGLVLHVEVSGQRGERQQEGRQGESKYFHSWNCSGAFSCTHCGSS